LRKLLAEVEAVTRLMTISKPDSTAFESEEFTTHLRAE
jgi:hypothetical protein